MAINKTQSSRMNFHIDDYLNPYLPHVPIERLPTPISRFLGYRKEKRPDVPAVYAWFWSFVGALCGLLVIEAIVRYSPVIQNYNPPIVIASLGASAILDYNAIHTPLAQPRNAILGQTLSSIVGVAITKAFMHNSDFENIQWVAGAVCCATASLVMSVTNTVHPPGGATALLAATNADIVVLGWMFVPLVILGSIVMLAVALLINNIQRQYPLYWWTAQDLRKTKEVDIEKVPGENADGLGKVPSSGSEQTLRVSSFTPGLQKDLGSIVVGPDHLFVPDTLDLDTDELRILSNLQSRLKENWAGDERPSAP